MYTATWTRLEVRVNQEYISGRILQASEYSEYTHSHNITKHCLASRSELAK